MTEIVGVRKPPGSHELGILLDEVGRFVAIMDVPPGYSRVRVNDILPDELGTTQVISEHLPRRRPRAFEKRQTLKTHWSQTSVGVYFEVR